MRSRIKDDLLPTRTNYFIGADAYRRRTIQTLEHMLTKKSSSLMPTLTASGIGLQSTSAGHAVRYHRRPKTGMPSIAAKSRSGFLFAAITALGRALALANGREEPNRSALQFVQQFRVSIEKAKQIDN